MWDQRQEMPVWSINHGIPVEYCSFSPSGSILATVGGNEVKLWDVVNGGRLVHTFQNHQKNITSITFDANASRLLSAGLDGHVKIYNMATLEVAHGIKFASPILSFGLSADSRKMVIGFVDGNMMIRNNKKQGKSAATPDNNILRPDLSITDMIDRSLSQCRHHKGAGQVHEFQNTIISESERGIHLQPFEKYLKKFSYQRALDSALETKDPVIVITLIEELCRRNGLTIALSGRDENSLEPILSFTAKYISHARYNDLVIQVAHRIIDMYSCVVGQSDRIDELFMKLHKQVNTEVCFQRDVKRVVGAVDCIINVGTMPKRRKLA
jgi:U3 small nucleolar RNA-associated protein 15